jgi:hypothetical protein
LRGFPNTGRIDKTYARHNWVVRYVLGKQLSWSRNKKACF